MYCLQSTINNFAIVLHVYLLLDAIDHIDERAVKLYGEPDGKPVWDTLSRLRKQHPEQLILLVGPEGDLTAQEKTELDEHSFERMALTPTILRAPQAAFFLTAIFRSVFS